MKIGSMEISEFKKTCVIVNKILIHVLSNSCAMTDVPLVAIEAYIQRWSFLVVCNSVGISTADIVFDLMPPSIVSSMHDD